MIKTELIAENSIKLTRLLSDFGFTTITINKALKNKDVSINGIKTKENLSLKTNDVVIIYTNSLPPKRFEIIYEDENIYIINKYAGIEVTGNLGLEGKLKNAIAVNRLDRNTTGILPMAKNEKSKTELDNAIKKRLITKKYLCEVIGSTSFVNYNLTAYLVKDSQNSLVKIYNSKLDSSEKVSTIFNTVKNNEKTSLVEATLITGKTHQIRASLKYLGHPILGDNKYGETSINKEFKANCMHLHSYYLKFNDLKGPLFYLNNKEFILYPNW